MARWHQDCKNCDGEPLAWAYSEGCQKAKMEILGTISSIKKAQ
jgi:hypothetical protein